jgi:hypothetical protein
MTTPKLIALRLYNVTLGRAAWGARLLRVLLVRLLITDKENEERYVASSRYFSFDEMEG